MKYAIEQTIIEMIIHENLWKGHWAGNGFADKIQDIYEQEETNIFYLSLTIMTRKRFVKIIKGCTAIVTKEFARWTMIWMSLTRRTLVRWPGICVSGTIRIPGYAK